MRQIWYKAVDINCKDPIQTVEISSFTDHTVVLPNARRVKRVTGFESYFPTWALARDHLMALVEERINELQRKLTHQNEHLAKLAALPPPENQ